MMSGGKESQAYFWLKSLSQKEGKETNTSENQFDGLYLRLVGSGSEAVVLTEQPPKFLRSHLSSDRQLCFTSSAPQHSGRQWAFVLDDKAKEDPQSTTNRPAWAPVLIRESQGDTGFSLIKSRDKDEITFSSEHDSILSSDRADFHGFVVCQWAYGHPQLFWLTEAFREGELPEFMKRVKLMKSPYVPSS